MRKLIAFLTVLILTVLIGASCAADSFAAPETPPPARIHIAPASAEELPAIINATKDTSAANGLRFKLDAEILHIWFPIIANADEAVLICGDQVWLIDCGDNGMGQRGVRMMQELGITKIEKLFISHPHHDHLGGLNATNDAIPVGELLLSFPEDSTESMIAAMEYINEKNIPVTHFSNGEVFTMGTKGRINLKFFWPEDESLDMNNSSAQTMLEYGSRRILFTADMERPGQQVLLTQMDPEELHADILKYPHHGKSGLVDEYLEAVSPSMAIITNVWVDWGGIEYLKWKRIPYVFTCFNDSYVHLYTDGNTWVVERVPMGQAAPLFPTGVDTYANTADADTDTGSDTDTGLDANEYTGAGTDTNSKDTDTDAESEIPRVKITVH